MATTRGRRVCLAAVALSLIAATCDGADESSCRTSLAKHTLTVEQLSELTYQTDRFTVPEGPVEVEFFSTGGTGVLVILGNDDLVLRTRRGGKKDRAIVCLEPGTYTIGSAIPGHRAAGLEATLVVTPVKD